MRDYKDTLCLPFFRGHRVYADNIGLGTRLRCIDASPVQGMAKGQVDLTVGNEYEVADTGSALDYARFVGVMHDQGDFGVYRRERFEVINAE